MVEAMFERSPSSFKQFQKQFNFLIVEEKLCFSIGNFYAVGAHFDSEFCNLLNSHYQVLIDTTTFENETLKRYQSFPMPCVYTGFKFLFWTAPNLETIGDVLSKLKIAIEFNCSAEKTDSQSARKRLPAFTNHNNLSKSSSAKQTNVDHKSSAKMQVVVQKNVYNARPPSNKFKLILLIVKLYEELKQFCMVLILVLFCQIMDIIMSGCGKLYIDSDLLSLRFVYEKSKNLKKKINFSS